MLSARRVAVVLCFILGIPRPAVIFENCVLILRRSPNDRPAIDCIIFRREKRRTLTISNCLFWNNHDSSGETESAQIAVRDGNPLVSYTLIQGLDLYAAGTGNIGLDPLFVSDDDLRLSVGLRAINSCDPGTAIEDGETDLDGQDRIQVDRVDLGAYEVGAGVSYGVVFGGN